MVNQNLGLPKSMFAEVRAKKHVCNWLSVITIVESIFSLLSNSRSFYKLAKTLAIDIGVPILWQCIN
jgi:hypothetical protein